MDNWDIYKENIQPLAQGRKTEPLFNNLELIARNNLRLKIQQERRQKFDQDLEAVDQDPHKQLDLWVEYIDWLEQNVPDGGKVNGITTAIEQCIEFYYDKNEFKQDERLFDIFMKFKRFCDEPTEVFSFMYANSISTLLARFYLNWSWQYEIKKNMKRAEDLLKLALKNLATPRDVLVEAQQQLKCRIARMIRSGELDATEPSSHGPRSMSATVQELQDAGIRAALQSLKSTAKVPVRRIGSALGKTGGLKSQTKIVNGIRVPKTMKPKSNKPIVVLSQIDEASSSVTEAKVPTSQRIGLIGKRGSENDVPRGRIVIDHENQPNPPRR